MSTPISQTTSSNPADHHTPLETGSSIPSHTTTNAGPTSTTPGSTGALGGATPSAASHSASSTGQHPASSSATPGSSDAAAGLGSNPWEGKELPSAAAQHPDHANGGDVEGAGQEVGEDGLPVQHHAGKVGLGPNYKKHPNTGDKIGGTIEEIKGKILHKPEVAQHGADRKTGALEEKKAQADDNNDPFKKEEDSSAGAGAKEAVKAAPAGHKSSEHTSTPGSAAAGHTTSATPSHTTSHTGSTTAGATPVGAESTPRAL